MNPVLAFFLLFLTLGCSSRSVLPDQTVVIPVHAGEIRQAPKGSNCIDVSGEYAFLGENLPGYPSKYRGWYAPLTLDVLLGMDLPQNSGNLVRTVRIRQKDNKQLAFQFIYGDRVSTFREIVVPSEQEPRRIECQPDRIVMTRENITTYGEATRGKADFRESFFLRKDGDLIVYTEGYYNDSFLFIPISSKEEHWVRYKAQSQ